MKIYLLNKEGKKNKEFINVSYLSFLKVWSLSYLGIVLIIFSIFILLGLFGILISLF